MRLILLYISMGVVLLNTACKKAKLEPTPQKFRTVLVYLAANNNLVEDANNNMEQMEEAIGDIDGDLIVYAKLPYTPPKLYHISKEEGTKEIKTYNSHNSSHPAVLEQVIADTKALYPASTYGLVLWSHATGWVPPDIGTIKLKSFGDDNGSHMDIKDLNGALPNDFDFIMFDACSMASVEVLYEVKDKAKYFIVSPGEVISNGMPYDKIINDLFSRHEGSYNTVANKYYQHYNEMSGRHRSATVSVIDAAGLENLAQKTKTIIGSQEPIYEDYNRDQIQRMDFDPTNVLIAFDFQDFMEQNYGDSQLYSVLPDAIENTVLFEAHTPEFNGVPILKHSGLSCYIPHEDNEQRVHAYYRTLKWYTAAGFDALF